MYSMLSLLNLNISEEAIAAQFDSKFPEKLEQLIQDLMDYGEHNKTSNELHTETYNKIKKYFKKVTEPKLIKVVHDYTGITFSKIYTDSSFAVMLDSKSIKGILKGLEAAVGYKKLKNKQLTEQLLLASKQLDRSTGKINLSKLPFSVKIKLFFDLQMTCFYKESFLFRSENNVTSVPLTAREITAILLHEVGHIITMFENMGNLSYIANYVGTITSNLKKDQNPEVVIKNFKRDVSIYKKLINQFKDVEIFKKMSFYSKITNILNRIEFLIKNPNLLTNETITKKFLSISIIFVLMVIFPFFAIYILITYISAYLLEEDLVNMFLSSNKANSKYTITTKQTHMYERLADEYVSLFGYSSDLNSGLEKITNIYFSGMSSLEYRDIIQGKKGLFKQLLLGGALVIISYLLAGFRIISYIISASSNITYEDLFHRVFRSLENTYANFKDPTLTIETKRELSKEIRRLKSQLKQNTDESLVRTLRTRTFKIISDYILGGKLEKALVSNLVGTGGMAREMKQCIDDIESLINNPMYYQSYNFSSLVK